jgi:hypothetical protein
VLGKNKETGIKIDTTKENMYKYKEYMGKVAWIEQKKARITREFKRNLRKLGI